MTVDVGQGRRELGERAAWRSGDPGGEHHFLGECLRRLDPRGGGRGAEYHLVRVAQTVRQPAGERRFRPDDDEIHSEVLGGADELIELIGSDGEIVGELGGARVTRRTVEGHGGEVLVHRPAERVLPASSSDDQYLHDCCDLRKASRADVAARFAASATLLIVSRASSA